METYLLNLRRYFHQHPELSQKEFETATRIESELDALGIEHCRVGETGVAGYIRGTAASSTRVVALRADIDALPIDEKNETPYASKNAGAMHACGHDAHTAILLGAAKMLREREAGFSGEVRLFFQQSEETGQGARQFITGHYLDGVSAILGVHVSPLIDAGKIGLMAGPTNASCDYFKITVHGKSAHVSTPQLGIDAAHIACRIVVDLQSIVSRLTDPLDTVVVGVGTVHAGTSYNIIANEATIEGTTRSFTKETRKQTNEAVCRIAESAARAQGGTVDAYFESYAAPLVNDENVIEKLREIAGTIAGKQNVLNRIQKSLTADDFANYLEKVPGAYMIAGTRNSNNPSTALPLHNERFDIDESALLPASRIYAEFAISFLK